MPKLTVVIDDELEARVRAYGTARNESFSQAVRELLAEGLLSKDGAPVADAVGRRVRHELGAFLESLRSQTAYQCDDVLASLDDSLSMQLAEARAYSAASLALAAEAAGIEPGEAVSRAMSLAWGD